MTEIVGLTQMVERQLYDHVEFDVLQGVDSHATRLKDCLAALRTANVPLDPLTASALAELSARIINSFNEATNES